MCALFGNNAQVIISASRMVEVWQQIACLCLVILPPPLYIRIRGSAPPEILDKRVDIFSSAGTDIF